MKFKTTHAPRVISTAHKPTAVVNAQSKYLVVKDTVEKDAATEAASTTDHTKTPLAKAQAAIARAEATLAKGKAASGTAHAKLLADVRAYVHRHKKEA